MAQLIELPKDVFVLIGNFLEIYDIKTLIGISRITCSHLGFEFLKNRFKIEVNDKNLLFEKLRQMFVIFLKPVPKRCHIKVNEFELNGRNLKILPGPSRKYYTFSSHAITLAQNIFQIEAINSCYMSEKGKPYDFAIGIINLQNNHMIGRFEISCCPHRFTLLGNYRFSVPYGKKLREFIRKNTLFAIAEYDRMRLKIEYDFENQLFIAYINDFCIGDVSLDQFDCTNAYFFVELVTGSSICVSKI